MDNANALTTTDGGIAIAPVSLDIGADFTKEHLPAEKRTELAVVAQNLKLGLAHDVAERTIRLQASSVDMDQTIRKADELSRVRSDFVIKSTHDTASGRTEITVRRHSPVIWIVLGVATLILLVLLKK